MGLCLGIELRRYRLRVVDVLHVGEATDGHWLLTGILRLVMVKIE